MPEPYPHPDPLDALTPFGVRVIWVHDLDADVLFLDDEGIVLADVDLPRHEVADRMLAALGR